MSRLDPSLLAGLPPFMGMDQPALEHILEGAKPLRQPKNAHVFRQGEEAHSFYLLLDGYVRVVKLAPDGEQVIVRFIASGEFAGHCQGNRQGQLSGKRRCGS